VIITADVAKLTGKARIDAMEKNQKSVVAECEKDAGYRCTVASYYGGLEFYLHQAAGNPRRAPGARAAEGVGKFGGDTDNWMWPRHTGDYGFYRAYVSRDGKAADFSEGQRALRAEALPEDRQGRRQGRRLHHGRWATRAAPTATACRRKWRTPSTGTTRPS
jgi:hypothetical protein